MSLDSIGFYTLSDERAMGVARSARPVMRRGELIITSRCNFHCPYCRGVEAYSRDCMGDMSRGAADEIIDYWSKDGLRAIRFSGGEPTLHPSLGGLMLLAKSCGVKDIALSTNGSAARDVYDALLLRGANDISISLDACCADAADKMAGVCGYWNSVVQNISWLSRRCYVTVGIVLTDETANTVVDTVAFAHGLGVSDIRIISAAQYNGALGGLGRIPQGVLDAHPILKYRVTNLLSGRNVRGLRTGDSDRCYLARDDSAAAGRWHWPCVIYMREGGEPIGEIGAGMAETRMRWSVEHDTTRDPICSRNCLDCLVDYNNAVEKELKQGVAQ